MATTPYTPPGVNITEQVTPTITPAIGNASNLCLVGLPGNLSGTQTPLTTTDVIVLTGTTPVVLPTLAALNNDAILNTVLSVTDVLNPSVGSPLGSGYTVTTDYTVSLGQGPPDGTHGTITRVSNGTIPSGRLVAVTYTYYPSDYYNPIQLFDIGSVESRFGPAWATATNPTTGQTYYTGVNSQLSMAARLAFENGASSVICQPLFARGTPGDPTTAQVAPSANAVGNVATWQDTLYVLRSVPIDVLVPVVGQDGSNVTDSGMLSIFGAFQSHMAYMNTQEQEMVSIFGEDGTVEGIGNNGSGLMNTMRTTHATSLQSNFANALSCQCALINNTVYQRPTPSGVNVSIALGGQYAAAAVGGALVSRSTSQSLTRKTIVGFVNVTDPRTPADKNSDAAAGLMVLEQNNNVIRCRQANTLDIVNGSPKSELSVIRSKFLMVSSIRDVLDNQIIGNIIADANSPIIVRSAIASTLSLLQDAGVIVGYTAPTAALTNLNPTTITASFSYQAAFPVNYINVSFQLDLTANTITTTTT